MRDDNNALQKIPPDQLDALRVVLVTVARDGISIAEACRRGEITRARYYQLADKKGFDEFAAKARREAEGERRELQAASDHRQLAATRALRDSAAELLMEGLPHLRRILTEDSYTVVGADGKKKTVHIYPRDFNASLKLAQELAQFGTLPEAAIVPQIVEKPALPRLPSVSAQFTSVALPPGSKVAIETPEVIDGEVEVIED